MEEEGSEERKKKNRKGNERKIEKKVEKIKEKESLKKWFFCLKKGKTLIIIIKEVKLSLFLCLFVFFLYWVS